MGTSQIANATVPVVHKVQLKGCLHDFYPRVKTWKHDGKIMHIMSNGWFKLVKKNEKVTGNIDIR